MGSLGSVGLRAGGQSVFFSVVFSDGTRLLVDVNEKTADSDEDNERLHRHGDWKGSGPSVQILSSIPPPLDPGSAPLLVCVLSGFSSPPLDVLWWVDDTAVTSEVTSADATVSWMRSEQGGAYSAISVWEVSAADWSSRSTYWCGSVQDGTVYRQRSKVTGG
ncbi:uncharacterized protein LOC122989011 [Scomber scombrus]|uniref:Uncharacterized protein LOC122989011 n=1 Tax=Scomber scombrus TaxID=13677 RepID=A0AAV1QFA4_SCOSC